MSDFYTKLVSGLLFPIHERLKHHTTVAVRKQLEETQWWPRERLETLQLDRLRNLLTKAQNDVPYYRDLFSSIGFNAEKISALAELKHLPFLTKPIIRKNQEQLKSTKAENLTRFRRTTHFLYRQRTGQP